MDDVEVEYVFVYGTLRPGYSRLNLGSSSLQPPNVLHQNGKYVGSATLFGNLTIEFNVFLCFVIQINSRRSTKLLYFIDLIGSGFELFDTGHYPGIRQQRSSQSCSFVNGDVFQIQGVNASQVLNELDVYEECSLMDPLPHEYTRKVGWH